MNESMDKELKMLSTAPSDDDRILENFKMFLVLTSAGNGYSQVLKDYFFGVLLEASELADEPAKLTVKTTPEAVTLAVKVLRDAKLKNILLEIGKDRTVTALQAQSALKSMENSFAFSNKPSNLGEKVYATL